MAPLIPPPKPGGNKRTRDMREVVNGLMYVLSTGCQWRAIPKDLPPRSTVYGYFDLWDYDGTVQPEFKWSSQHLERGGCDDRLEAAFGSVRARRLALAGSALWCAA